MRVSVSSSQSVNRFKNTFHWSPSANAVGLLCFSLSALCTYTITRRESKRLLGGFRTFSAVFRTASGRFDGFRELRALLPVGAGCAQARVAYWRVCSARQTTARTRRRELHARPQARWRSDRRVLFAVAILLADCGNPAQIAARLSRLQRSSPNGGILFRTADFFPNCEVLLRTADLFPNDGVPSRAAWFFVQLRKFLPNGGVLAGLACPRGLAWRTLPRHRRRAFLLRWVQGGKFG